MLRGVVSNLLALNKEADEAVLMADPNWNRGFYYDGIPPHNGMKLARRKLLAPPINDRKLIKCRDRNHHLPIGSGMGGEIWEAYAERKGRR